MADGTRVDVGQLTADQLRRFKAEVGGRKAEVWKLTSDTLLGAHYRPGQLLIVDLDADVIEMDGKSVLALHDGVAIFRLYFHPQLFTLRLTENDASIQVDNKRTIIKGMVVRDL